MEKEINFTGIQYQGARDEQQDSHAFGPMGPDGNEFCPLLAVVADGMGGEDNGRLCSEYLVRSMIDLAGQDSSESIPEKLYNALIASNDGLEEEKGGVDKDGGTTLVAAWIEDKRFYRISVGDSLLFLLRGDQMDRLNEDHSMQPELLKRAEAGEMTREEALQHRDRHILCSAVCGDKIEMIDCPDSPHELESGDILLLASDGLQTLSEEHIRDTIIKFRDNTAASIANVLMEHVERKDKPGQDNVTILLIKVP